MKVCIVASIFHPYNRGGAEVVAQNAALAFRQAGDEVVVITTRPWGGLSSLWPKIDEWQGIKIYRYYPLNIFSFLNIAKHNIFTRLVWHVFDMFNLHTYFVARDILLEEKPRIIMTHNLKGLGYTVHLSMHHPSFFTYHPLWIHTIHDIGAIHPTGLLIYGRENSFLQKFFLARWYARINIRLLGSPNWVISPSQFLLDYYTRHGFFLKSKKIVIRNPILVHIDEKSPSIPLFERGKSAVLSRQGFSPVRGSLPSGVLSLSQRESQRGIYQKGESERDLSKGRVREGFIKRESQRGIFLYLGQLEPYKGLSFLLDAWQEFCKIHPDSVLQIAGGGSMEAKLKKYAHDNPSIIFHGFVPHEQIDALLQQAHFSVVPSLAYESASMGVAESLAYGVPVIASRLGAIPEIVQDGQNGFLFTPGDKSDLLRVIQLAIDCDWQSLSQNAKKSAVVFSIESYLKSVKALCQSS